VKWFVFKLHIFGHHFKPNLFACGFNVLDCPLCKIIQAVEGVLQRSIQSQTICLFDGIQILLLCHTHDIYIPGTLLTTEQAVFISSTVHSMGIGDVFAPNYCQD